MRRFALFLMNEKADLHCHSTFSDGSLSPLKLLELAQKKGLFGLSITDHDTIDAYPEAIVEASSRKLLLLNGVELSARAGNESIHILAFGFPISSPKIKALCLQQKEMRRARNLEIVALLKSRFRIEIPLPEREAGSVGRIHIALELLKKGAVKTVREAFEKYIGDGKGAYILGEKLTCEKVIDEVHLALGKAILAHPHLIVRKRVLKALFEMDFDGIEAFYARLPLPNEKPVMEIAKSRGWILTGGSDFHGEIKPYLDLGCAYTPKETFDLLYQHQLSLSE